MKSLQLKIILGYFLLVLIWGSTWMAIKVSIGDTPFMLAALRFLLAGLALVIYQIFHRRAIFPPLNQLQLILALGLGNFFLGYGLSYYGMQYVNSNITSILWATLPVAITVLAHFMLESERIQSAAVFSILGSLLGTLIIFDLGSSHFDSLAAFGMGMILVSVLAAAYPNVLFKKQGLSLDPVAVNAAAMLIGALLLFLTGLVVDPWQTIRLTPLRLGATLYLALVGSAYGFSLYFWLMQKVSVVKMSYTTFLIPIVASFWGWVILKESLTGSALLGASIILISVGLPEFWRKKHRSRVS